MVIAKHKLPVSKIAKYKENDTGSCWYDSIAVVIRKLVAEGKMGSLKMETKGPDVRHPDLRAAVCDYIASDDCIMKESWIKENFGGDKER